MLEIVLDSMEFYAYHGFYKQEQELGNKYTLDLKVTLDPPVNYIDINATVDYQILYNVVKEEMGKSFKLLETIADNISKEIFIKFPYIFSVEVSVAKHNPPLGGICNKAKVTLKKQKD